MSQTELLNDKQGQKEIAKEQKIVALDELKDIAGFDQVGGWPPAPVWWVAGSIVAVLILIGGVSLIRRFIYRFSWKYDALIQLENLEKVSTTCHSGLDPEYLSVLDEIPDQVRDDNGGARDDNGRALDDNGDIMNVRMAMQQRQIISNIAELAKRIAMQEYSREECANLSGNLWLEWLEAHDPKKFKWSEHGKVMIHATYAPPSTGSLEYDAAKKLINALKEWVRR